MIGAFGLHMVATYERPLEELKNKGSEVVKYLRAKAGSLLADYAVSAWGAGPCDMLVHAKSRDVLGQLL